MEKGEKPDNQSKEVNNESRNVEYVELAIEALAHVLQRHLLIFAYTTYAYRINPAVRNEPFGEPIEKIFPPDLPNFDGDDDDGEFLLESLNQRLLIKHMEKAYSEFGKDKGKRPKQMVQCAENESRVGLIQKDIEGGTFPAWRLSYAEAHYYLEKSTGNIINSVTNLRKVDTLGRFNEVADLAGEVARPAGHPIWDIPSTNRPEENIPWNYPQQVLEAASLVKDAKSQVFKQYPKRAKVEKEKSSDSCIWKLYEKTIKALFDAIIDHLNPS